MTELALPQGGSTNWSNGFLPPYYQGTRLRPEGSPLLDLKTPGHRMPAQQQRMIEELTKLNQRHLETLSAEDERLQARIANYELAFRMQTEIPDVIDCDTESEQTLKMYGVDEPDTDAFGRQCLLARRLVENGVRFVQIFSGGWDSHDYLKQGHTS
ncbi:unnamed protein product, partial [marine sediment metagenome]